MLEVPTWLFVAMLAGLGAGMLAFAWIADHADPSEKTRDMMVPREALKGGSHE